ncbi:MAG: HAMP domain-containing histidine kinase [Gemmataceae bacterium]|nr:HAMP domain-containing histidine kinase [Gemmataceae bacterium]
MKSLRRTLLLNVLALLVVSLGLVSFFVYRTAEGALRERQRTARELVEVRYGDRRDEALRNRADELAGEVQSNWNRDKAREIWLSSQLFALSAPITPIGHPPLNGAAAFELSVRLSTELKLDENYLYRDSNAPGYEFVETTDLGTHWRSRSLASHVLRMDETSLKPDADARTTRFDFLELPNGMVVRRVVVKAPVTKFSREGSFWFSRPSRSVDAPPPSRGVVGMGALARFPDRRFGPGSASVSGPVIPPTPSPTGGYTSPTFFLHCAWEDSSQNPRLAPLIRDRDERLEAIDADTEASVRSLRSTLAWTVAGAVAATLFGVWILVGLGLAPLKRLSFAVSQISPKDFHLPMDPRSLPSEVNPVAERLSLALEQLQAAFEREKRASADISHELRTPLAALTTTLEVACRKVRTAEQYRQSLDDCRGIAKEMSHLVERILLLAWSDAGVDVLRPERVELGKLVSGVATIGKPLAENKGLTFRVNVPKPIAIHTDPDKLREVVMNLIHNAIEYNQPGGAVEVSAERTVDGGVLLEVRDTGIGMAPEILDKIFERFFRGDPSRTETGVHAGLGLAIVKEYVDRLGGRLSVESKVGLGTQFRIELPNAL